MKMQNFYAVLGVPKHADDAQIKRAYRKLAMQHHPDRNCNSLKSEEIFKEVQVAFDHLSDPIKRQVHDDVLMGRVTSQYSVYAEAATEPTPYDDGIFDSVMVKQKGGWGRWFWVAVVLFFILALIATMAMYQIQNQHPNALDAATPVAIKLKELLDEGVLTTGQVHVQNVAISDKRVQDAMNHLYGENTIHSASASCWLATIQSTGSQYCMQPLAAFFVRTDVHQLLYLQATGDWIAGNYAGNRSASSPQPMWGAGIYDLDALTMLATTPFVDFLENTGKRVKPLKLVQISCNGAFAWQGRLSGDIFDGGYPRIVLYAQKSNGIVDVMGDRGNQAAGGKPYPYTFVPSQKEGCIYAMQFNGISGSGTNEPVYAYFNTRSWSYR